MCGRSWDHPRVGGEKHSGSCRTLTRSGSPPRGRGKAKNDTHTHLVYGITPAWAGKSAAALAPAGGRNGSPPRGRGKGYDVIPGLGGIRITPAWAGKRRWHSHACTRDWDHPRVGGEKPLCTEFSSHPKGSPPRGRGKECKHFEFNPVDGITPAWAGKSPRL